MPVLLSTTFWTHDVGKILTFTLTSGDTAFNLTGASVTMLLHTGQTFPVSVASALSGSLHYTVPAETWHADRRYRAQFRARFASATLHSDLFELHVKKTVEE